MQLLSYFYSHGLRMTEHRDWHAFQCAFIAFARRLRYAVDPDGTRPAVPLHDAIDGDGVRAIRRYFLLAGFDLGTLFGSEKQPPQLFCIRDCCCGEQ